MDSSYNGLGGFGSGAISSGDLEGIGDIVLKADTKFPIKKIVGIGVVLLVLVVTGFIVWSLVSKFAFKATPESAKEKFNKFANYVISGEELKTEIDPEYDSSHDYYFAQKDLTSDQKKAIYGKTKQLFDGFMDQYNRLDDEEKYVTVSNLSQFESWSKGVHELVDFMSVVYKKDNIDDDKIAEIYLTKGEDAVLKIPDDYYDFSRMEENTYVVDFLENLQVYVETELEVLELLDAVGCLGSSDEDNVACISRYLNGSVPQNYQSAVELKDRAYSYLKMNYGYNRVLVLRVFVLNALINNGDITNYVTS